MTATAEQPTAPAEERRHLGFWGYVFAVVCVGFVVFWVWALFFASKVSINRIDDHAWAQRAERICTDAEAQRAELIDLRPIDHDDPSQLVERAGIVDQATRIVEDMLDDIVAVTPADAKGQELVPRWEADYRTYIGNRREFTSVLRQGRNDPFRETALDGIPISDKLARFANDNHMPSCAPPLDLSS